MNDLRGQLTDFLHSYAHYADRFDLDAFIGLFADDAVIDFGTPLTPTEFRAMMTQNQIDTKGLSPRHVLSNLVFTALNESEATGAMYFTYHQTIDGEPKMLMSGTYDFELKTGPEGWRIRSWRVSVDSGN